MRKLIPYIVSIGLSGFLFYNSVDVVKVSGNSMEPLIGNGQTIVGIKTDYYVKGNIVVAKIPDEDHPNKTTPIIKRVYGEPKDYVKIEKGKVSVNGEVIKFLESRVPDAEFKLKRDEYFLLGDAPTTAWVKAKLGAIESRMEGIKE